MNAAKEIVILSLHGTNNFHLIFGALLSHRLYSVVRIWLGGILIVCLKDVKRNDFGKEQTEDEF